VKLTLGVVGRLRSGPEKDLADDYIARAAVLGRGLGFPAIDLVEYHPKGKADKTAISAQVLSALPQNTMRIVLDERGKDISSAEFSRLLARWRDEGCAQGAMLIGGADGWSQQMRDGAGAVLRFGAWTWPHRLVRIMAAEQLYRGLSILAQSPYHREG
jgi:23S rRNA (pseudouridine1915-N3)-methyltransferase